MLGTNAQLTKRKYVNSEICHQSKFTHWSMQRRHRELNCTSTCNDSLDSMLESDNDNEMVVVVPGTVASSFNTHDSGKQETCTFGTETISMAADDRIKTNDDVKTSQKRKNSRPVPYKRVVDRSRLSLQGQKVTEGRDPPTITAGPQFTGQSSLTVLVDGNTSTRECSKPVSYKRLGNKRSLFPHRGILTQSREPLTAPASQQVTGQRSQRVNVEGSTSTSFQCNRCQKQFKSRSALISHQVFVHNKSSNHQCTTCDKYLPSASVLKDHMAFHEGTRNYECDICLKRFFRKSHLKRHRRIHTGDRPYTCEICAQNFNTRTILQTHLRTHTGEKPYVCEMCGKQFSARWSLISHMKTHIS